MYIQQAEVNPKESLTRLDSSVIDLSTSKNIVRYQSNGFKHPKAKMAGHGRSSIKRRSLRTTCDVYRHPFGKSYALDIATGQRSSYRSRVFSLLLLHLTN